MSQGSWLRQCTHELVSPCRASAGPVVALTLAKRRAKRVRAAALGAALTAVACAAAACGGSRPKSGSSFGGQREPGEHVERGGGSGALAMGSLACTFAPAQADPLADEIAATWAEIVEHASTSAALTYVQRELHGELAACTLTEGHSRTIEVRFADGTSLIAQHGEGGISTKLAVSRPMSVVDALRALTAIWARDEARAAGGGSAVTQAPQEEERLRARPPPLKTRRDDDGAAVQGYLVRGTMMAYRVDADGVVRVFRMLAVDGKVPFVWPDWPE